MKVILSRKGFDSSVGGCPSPIFPSGKLCSLPIPERDPHNERARPYEDIRAGGLSLGRVVDELTRGRLGASALAHLDPDLDAGSVPRREGWRPTFGQVGAAEGHLRNQGVGPGDLFIFFGWFRDSEEVDGRHRFVAGSPDRHVLFGWLQVERRISVAQRAALPEWALDHPHCKAVPYGKNDCLYVAAEELQLKGRTAGVPGGGLFRNYQPSLCLTASGESRRSVWSVPEWLHPKGRASCLSYHSRPSRWMRRGGQLLLQTVAQGQEFVLDSDDYPEAIPWLESLFDNVD